jgi:dephospho-CoA kinase
MIIIGVTGATGTGKSTVSKILDEDYFFRIINADYISFNEAQPGTQYLKEIEKTFGKKVINKDGSLNRKLLGDIIFNDYEQKAKLNKLTKKYVVKAIEELLTLFKEVSKSIKGHKEFKDIMDAIVIDAALLHEFKLDRECNYVICLTASDDVKLKRIMERSNLSEEEAKVRIKSQKEYEDVFEKSDYVVENNGTVEELKPKIDEVIKDIARRENLKLIL